MMYTALFYLAIAAVIATLGMGSILARRWARPLILVASWGWLLCGVLGLVMMFWILPQVFASMPDNQPGAKAFATGCMGVVFGVFGVLLPLTFILFYRRADVKATVEMLDPVPRWTDPIPIPLLGFASWMALGAVSVLASSLMYRALPLGGIMLSGWVAKLIMLFFAVLMMWIAYGSIRRLPPAWWSAIGLLVLGVVYGVVFITRMDYERWNDALGMPNDPRSIEMMRNMYSGPFFWVWMGLIWAVYLGFVLYLRRYFWPSERPAVQAPVDLQ
jgi:hypothetical protein